jgi:hypothetical protein
MRCRGLHRVANPAYLRGFLCSALPCVPPYGVPGGVRVVSEVRGIHVAGSFALERQLGTGAAYLQPAEFMPDYFRL